MQQVRGAERLISKRMNTMRFRRNGGQLYKAEAVSGVNVSRPEQFLCPECGSQEPEPASMRTAQKCGTGVRRGVVCARCHFEIPVHLAERWGRSSAEDARREWREVYRCLAKGCEER